MILKCKKCASEKRVRAGFIKGEQRWLCKACGCKYVPTRHHGRPERDKLWAVLLYLHGLSFRAIAKLLDTSASAVYNWVKAYAKANYIKPEPKGEAVVVELDEMWHFIHSKKQESGYGKLIAAIPINLSTGNVADEIMLHLRGFTKG
jgi:transposase